MCVWTTTVGRALVAGTMACLTSTLALALAACAKRKGALQPLNAAGHWLNGERGALARRSDGAHTVLGYPRHHAGTIFWAAIFGGWVSRHPPPTSSLLLADALDMSAIAAAVDYGPTPKRSTPGWEHIPSRRAMAAMALGLAAGAAVESSISPAARLRTDTRIAAGRNGSGSARSPAANGP